MRYDGLFDQLRAEVSRACHEPVEAAVMVHRSPDQPKRQGPRLGINNHLALTATRLRLHASAAARGSR